MNGAPIVVKIGGRALEDGALPELARDLAALDTPAVLVHGGGAEVSAWLTRLGLAPRFADGLRVTDPDTLDVAVAVLAGLANKRLVAGLGRHGVTALGLAALDGGIADVTLHPDHARLGAVGAVRAVRPGALQALLALGLTPVLASIGAHEDALLNINADDLAAAVAAALNAPMLVLLSDTPGLKLGGGFVPRLGFAALGEAIASPDVRDGMLPKLKAARAALEGGAARVWIAAWNGPGTLAALAAGRGPGTLLLAPDSNPAVREAEPPHVHAG